MFHINDEIEHRNHTRLLYKNLTITIAKLKGHAARTPASTVPISDEDVKGAFEVFKDQIWHEKLNVAFSHYSHV